MMLTGCDAYSLRRISWRATREWLTRQGTWRVGFGQLRMATSRRAFVAESGRYLPGLSVADLDGTSQASVWAQVGGRDGTLVDDGSGQPRRRD
jgi:hypothetical protein